MHVKPAPIDAERHPGLYADLPKEKRGSELLKVRDPDRRDFLPNEGRDVPASLYWHARLRDGDVVLVEPEADDRSAE